MASNHLFELIHSLSPTEKGYIKKTAFSSSNGEEKSYILLFDAIANQEVYDEDKIIKKFSGAAFIKNLSKSKNHLYHVILKRLAQYHEENVIEIKIKGLVNQATILYKKGLYEHAIIHFEKALKMALDAEELEVALEIYTCLLDIYFVGSMGVKFPYEEELKVLSKKLSNEHLIAYLHTKIAEKMFSDDFNTEPEQVHSIQNILNSPSLGKIGEDDSFYAKWGKMCIYTHSYYLMKRHDEADLMKEKQLQFLRNHPAMVQKTPMRYVKHLANMINGKLNVPDFAAIPPLLEELKNFKSQENLLEHVKPLQMSV
jgi:tetratricopeptide (TPR) repeat protein